MAAVPGILRQWNPGIVPNLQLWVDGSDKSTFTFTNESKINTISDKSGNGVILTQNVLINQPVLSSNINGRQTVSFPINTYMSTTTTSLTSKFNNNGGAEVPESQFLIFKLPNLNADNIITYMGDSTGTEFQQYEYDSFFQAGILSNISLRVGDSTLGNTYYTNIPNISCNVLFLKSYYKNIIPTQFTINAFINSNLLGNNSTNAPGNGYNINKYSNYYIGKSFYGPTSAQSFNGDLGEIVLFTSNYSSNMQYRPQMEGYLAWKWGVQSLLSNGHPYRNRIPS